MLLLQRREFCIPVPIKLEFLNHMTNEKVITSLLDAALSVISRIPQPRFSHGLSVNFKYIYLYIFFEIQIHVSNKAFLNFEVLSNVVVFVLYL